MIQMMKKRMIRKKINNVSLTKMRDYHIKRNLMALFFASCILSSVVFSSCKETYERPPNIPQSTFYLGGIDGGVWVDSFRKTAVELHYLVYTQSGELIDTCILIAENKMALEGRIHSVTGYNGKDLTFKDKK